MDPSPPPQSHMRCVARALLNCALLLAVAALALCLLYGAFLAVSTGSTAWPLRPATATASAARRTADVPSPEAWRTRDWRRAVDFHAALLADHLAWGTLAPSSRAVCLGGAQEALVMRELGVARAVTVHKRRSPPLVVAAADDDSTRLPFGTNSVNFVFAGRALDAAKRQADLAAEAARILKPQAHLALLTASAADAYSLRSLQALLPDLRLLRSREVKTQDGASTLRELLFQKSPSSSSSSSSSSTGVCHFGYGGRQRGGSRRRRRRGGGRAAAVRDACGGHGEERWGGGDGASPHVGAVVLPAEQRRCRTMGGALPLRVF